MVEHWLADILWSCLFSAFHACYNIYSFSGDQLHVSGLIGIYWEFSGYCCVGMYAAWGRVSNWKYKRL